MAMEIPDRVQIVPFGYESIRVLEPINRLKADRVILLRHHEESDFEAPFQADVIEELEANDRITLEQRRCDIFSLEESLRAIKRAITDCEPDDEVYVNLATGSKLTAIAGMYACQSVDRENTTPFYVEPEFRGAEGYREPPTEPLVEEIGNIRKIPVFGLDLPSREQQQMLAFVASHDDEHVPKKELIRYAEDQSLPFIAETESKSDEGKYRLLETHIIEPLEREGYVKIIKSGREKRVVVTEDGKEVLDVSPIQAD